MTSEQRRTELSSKFLQMGQALLIESSETKDFGTKHAAMVLILLSSNLLDEEDIYMFDQVCSMFSAKKTLEAMSNQDTVNDYLKEKVKPFINEIKVKGKPKDDNPDIDSQSNKTNE